MDYYCVVVIIQLSVNLIKQKRIDKRGEGLSEWFKPEKRKCILLFSHSAFVME